MSQEISAAELAQQELKLKESKEFVAGAIRLGKLFAAEMKDGFQASDLISIARKISMDEPFRDSLWEALKGVQSIPQELKEAKATEIAVELGQVVLDSLKA